MADVFERWVEASFERWLGELTWSEIARALGALSNDYVRRRHRVEAGDILAGRGKRAAFALYYAPRHYVLLRALLRELDAGPHAAGTVVDLGCGLGVAGAAWAAHRGGQGTVVGADVNNWALGEARTAARALALDARFVHSPVERLRWPTTPAAIVAAFTVNELAASARSALRTELLARHTRGSAVLIVEPLAQRSVPWWPEWGKAFVAAGGRVVEFRLPAAEVLALTPKRVVDLGRSAHLDPSELGARALWLAAPPPSSSGTAG